MRATGQNIRYSGVRFHIFYNNSAGLSNVVRYSGVRYSGVRFHIFYYNSAGLSNVVRCSGVRYSGVPLYHKLSPSCFVNYFNSVSSIHSYSFIFIQSQNDNLFVKTVHTTQYGIRSLSYTGTNLWNSLSTDVKKIKPFSSLRQNIKNSMIDGYNTIIDSLSLRLYYL